MKTNRRNFIKGVGALAAAVLTNLQTRTITTVGEQEPTAELVPVLSDVGEQQALEEYAIRVTADLEAHTMSSCCDFDFSVSYGLCVNPDLPIVYHDAKLVNHNPETGAMTFKYGEATNEPT